MKAISTHGELLVFGGAFFWSLNAPLVKFLQMDSFLLCGLRAMIAGVALAVFIRPKRLNWNRWMILYLVSYAALSLSIILALSMTASPVAIGMQYTAAVWIFIVGIFKNRRFDMRTFIPVAIIFIGMLFFMNSGSDNTSSTGNLIALFEGIFFACMTVSSPKAAGSNPLGLTAVANLFTGIVIFAFVPSCVPGIVSMTAMEWSIMLVLGVVQIGCGYALYNLGVQHTSAQKASVIALWEMILGPVWVALFLKEYPSPIVLAGFLIILLGMLLDSVLKNYPQSKTNTV